MMISLRKPEILWTGTVFYKAKVRFVPAKESEAKGDLGKCDVIEAKDVAVRISRRPRARRRRFRVPGDSCE